MMAAHATIPNTYGARKRLWINSSLWLSINERPYCALAIQNLGYAERLLLEMELRLAAIAMNPDAQKERNRLLPECSAHSALWILGLYEVLRVLRAAEGPRFDVLDDLFWKLEILRMPLAKHEQKSLRYGAPVPLHYPTGVWEPERGRVGWSIVDPRTQTVRAFTRTELADEFLAVAAVEPEHPPPFPIGGSLGMPDDS